MSYCHRGLLPVFSTNQVKCLFFFFFNTTTATFKVTHALFLLPVWRSLSPPLNAPGSSCFIGWLTACIDKTTFYSINLLKYSLLCHVTLTRYPPLHPGLPALVPALAARETAEDLQGAGLFWRCKTTASSGELKFAQSPFQTPAKALVLTITLAGQRLIETIQQNCGCGQDQNNQ